MSPLKLRTLPPSVVNNQPSNVNPIFEDKNEGQKRGLLREFIPRRPGRERAFGGLGVCLRGCKNRTIPHVRRDPDRRGQPFGQDGVQIDAGGRKQPYLRPCLLLRRDRLDNEIRDCEYIKRSLFLLSSACSAVVRLGGPSRPARPPSTMRETRPKYPFHPPPPQEQANTATSACRHSRSCSCFQSATGFSGILGFTRDLGPGWQWRGVESMSSRLRRCR